ncbi:GNAT family N-acetyltransferase [Georgenia sp. TF02-10]|uniref:GNAT family N-acetyltransferase n=1 Tax=Georgenia sp. TF02-10 TaxID=2917725 RepID=UPI001FA7765D|nr:GNAT family N-acetyltransferase [Georgenia sp. TF02-10]UNX53257.1 GNAT family N-acetyltransferase [Georgenia sp. TF02-10]
MAQTAHAGAQPAADGGLGPAARWPFLRANGHRWVPERTWDTGDATAVLVPRGAGRMLVGVGSPPALAALLADVDRPAGADHVMLTRGTWDHVAPAERSRLGLEPGRPWDWLAATAPPAPRAGEDRVVPLTGPDRLRAVYGCLDAGYPERGRRAHDAELSWWGYRADDGALAGVVGADVPPPAALAAGAGVHLEAVAVVPAWRRRGVAAAMTAALTRFALGLGEVAHLGIWADNDAARRVYARLGYTTGQQVENLHPAG